MTRVNVMARRGRYHAAWGPCSEKLILPNRNGGCCCWSANGRWSLEMSAWSATTNIAGLSTAWPRIGLHLIYAKQTYRGQQQQQHQQREGWENRQAGSSSSSSSSSRAAAAAAAAGAAAAADPEQPLDGSAAPIWDAVMAWAERHHQRQCQNKLQLP